MKAAGFENIDFAGKFVAVKIHFGEPGNLRYLRPNWAGVVCDYVKELGGKPLPHGLQHPLCRRAQKRARPPRQRL